METIRVLEWIVIIGAFLLMNIALSWAMQDLAEDEKVIKDIPE